MIRSAEYLIEAKVNAGVPISFPETVMSSRIILLARLFLNNWKPAYAIAVSGHRASVK